MSSEVSVPIEEVLQHIDGSGFESPPSEAMGLLGLRGFGKKPSDYPTVTKGRVRHPSKLTDAQLWERRMMMAAMQAKGDYQRTIAEHFGVTIETVSQEIKTLVNEYRASALKSIGERVAEEEALIYMVQLEAIDAWYESKQGKVTNINKRVREIRNLAANPISGGGRRKKNTPPLQVAAIIRDDLNKLFNAAPSSNDPQDDLDEMFGASQEDNTREEEGSKHEESPGDPAFLKLILECSDRRAKLNNLYPKDGGTGTNRPGEGEDDFKTWTPKQRLARMKTLRDKAFMNKMTQLAIQEAGAKTTVEALNRAPLGLFGMRAEQLASGEKPEKLTHKVLQTPIISVETAQNAPNILNQQTGDPDWDAS